MTSARFTLLAPHDLKEIRNFIAKDKTESQPPNGECDFLF